MSATQENVDIFVARMREIISKLRSLKNFSDKRALTEKEKLLLKEALLLIREDVTQAEVSIKNHYAVPESLVKLRNDIENPDKTISLEMEIALAVSLEKQALYALECKKLSKLEANAESIEYLRAVIGAQDAKYELAMALKDMMLEFYRQRLPNNEPPEKEPATHQEPNNNKTNNATVARLTKRVHALTDGYEGAAKLASEIGRRGTKPGGNPWSESEILSLANELAVSIKGECLKAFKAGMPPELVKKDAGARPTSLREEQLDNKGRSASLDD